jgi:hypothetical protein
LHDYFSVNYGINDDLLFGNNLNTKSILFDIGAMFLIYFLPKISSLLDVQFYLFEPMRVVIVFAIVHTSKKNANIIALILPVVSYIFSNHPSVVKTIILSGDLLLNIFSYHSLLQFKVNKFLLMSISIVASKIFYYLIKYLLIHFLVLNGNLIATPIFIQIIIVIILSGYVYLLDKVSLPNQTLKQFLG